MTSPLHRFESKTGHRFADRRLLALALTHPSCRDGHNDNQRLEFLGDAALGLVVAETLYRNNPHLDEGALDRMRASLVNGQSLAAHARALGIDRSLQVSDAQRQHHAQPSSAMLEDAFEALIGAIYLDGGIDAARAFILRSLGDAIDAAPALSATINPKGRLQEWAQQQHAGAVPHYSALAATGPDHARVYQAAVHLNETELGRGQGSSKKAAESAAAADALRQLKR